MSSREKIDSIYDFTEKGLVELKAWLEPWWSPPDSEAAETPVATELPTIKGHYVGAVPSDHFTVGSVSVGHDVDWTYLYALPHPTLLYLSDGLITSAAYDPDVSLGSLYLVVASARLTDISNIDDTDPEASLQVDEDSLTEVDGLDRRLAISGDVRLQRSYVKARYPAYKVQVRHSADTALNCEVMLSVTLIHPGPVPIL